MPTLIAGFESEELFVGTEEQPLQVVRVYLAQHDLSPRGGSVRVRVEGSGVTTPDPLVTALEPGERERAVEVGVRIPASARYGDVLRVDVVVESLEGAWGPVRRPGPITVAEPGWTMFMVSHFHFDPVWWNTQSNYTEDWKSFDHPRLPFQTAAFDLLDRHLERAEHDPDYTFVIAELDYLKPYWDARPEQRARIRSLVAQGRLEVMGGTYNEPSTNLSSVEATARSAVYGAGFQRGVMGADPQSAWQLDVFGHDPQFPGLMAAAGLSSSSWARGPFHQNGPTFDYLGDYPLFFGRERPFRSPTTIRDPRRMEFPSEFEWVSPSGRGLLTSYMHNHYLCGWSIDAARTLEEAEQSAYELFTLMKRSTATRNVLLPLGTDYAIPSRWVTDIARDWARRYVWPRFVTGIPRDFFSAVRAALAAEGRVAIPQSRDMNPVWTGKDVSLIDTKQAQREIETVLVDAEKLATLAALRGAPYPEASLDLAWRQVFFGAHHDAVTGTGSDQVYVDLLGSWREAHDTAHGIRDEALRALAAHVDTSGAGIALVVANPLTLPRTDVVHVAVPVDGGMRILDPAGADVPFVVDTVDAGVATITLVAADVPSLGVVVYRVVPSDEPLPRWERGARTVAENDAYAIEVDPDRGGALRSIVHRASGKQVLQEGRLGAELVVYDEYPAHPNMGEGPWMLVPTGARVEAGGSRATHVWSESSPVGTRVCVRGIVDGITFDQAHTLWTGVDRIDGRVRVEEYDGADKLVRLRLPAAVEGARPVVEVGEAVIGRAVGFPDVDSAVAPWTLDTPANRWFGVSSTARVVLAHGEDRDAEAIGVAEVVLPAPDEPGTGARALVVALAAVGVTATVSSASGPRYGNLDVDSNLPDVRIAVGSPAENVFVESVLSAAAPEYRSALETIERSGAPGLLWVPATRPRASRLTPMADLRGVLDLPVLIAVGPSVRDAVDLLVDDLDDATIELDQSAESAALAGLEDFSVALVNRGTPGSLVDATGALHLSLLRSSTGWPSGVWIDPPRRTVPDGSTFHQQHWTHEFPYSIVAGRGDWRTARLVGHGHAVNHPLLAVVEDGHDGTIASGTSLLSIEPAERVHLGALKLEGNPIADGRGAAGARRGLTLRLTELAGSPVEARITIASGWAEGAAADLLENRREGLEVVDGRLVVSLAAAEIATIVGDVVGAARPDAVQVDTDTHFARWWLHNRGSAPRGFLPLSVHVARRTAEGGLHRTVDVTIANDRVDRGAAGRLVVLAPEGWTARPSDHGYALGPGEHVTIPVEIMLPEDTPEGIHAVTVRISGDDGSSVEDVVRVPVGGAPLTPQARAAELGVRLTTPSVRLAAGARGELGVEVTNATPSRVRAELHYIAPFAAWGILPAPSERLELDPGESRVLAAPLVAGVPAGRYWVLPKLMWHGEVAYAEAADVVIDR